MAKKLAMDAAQAGFENGKRKEALETEERYRVLFSLAPMAVYSCDASGVVRDYNNRAAELWGRKPEPGDTDERFCGSFKLYRADGSYMPHEQCPMADVLTGKIPAAHDAEVHIERPDGSRIIAVVNIAPVKNERGEITGAINCFYDVTERKRAQAALEESEQRLREVIDALPTAVYTTDAEGRLTHFNRACVELSGRTPKAGTDQWCVTWKLWRADGTPLPFDECPMAIALKEGRAMHGAEIIAERPNGERAWVAAYPAPLHNAEGEVTGGINMLVDITERKRAQKELERSHAELEALVEQRTEAMRKLSARLMHAQDEERRRISRELHDSVGQYVAHAKMSVDAWKRAGGKKDVEAIEHISQTLDKCMSEMRTISYLLHPPLLEEVGFRSAARWYLHGFAERSGIRVNVDIPTQTGRMIKNPETELALFRVLQESLTNAHRHSESESVDVALKITTEEVTLDVRDHGKGIAPEVLQRLRTGVGGGIGLIGMRERISELGGWLEIESNGNGTLIRVVIPARVAQGTGAARG